MTKTASMTLLCALALGACNSSKDVSEMAQDAGDAAQNMSSRDAAANGGGNVDGGIRDGGAGETSALDAAASGGDAASAGNTDAATRTLSSLVYVGGAGDAYPVRTYALDRATGALTAQAGTSNLGDHPTYITPSADHKFLYVANESSGTGVTVASIGAHGALTKLDLEPTKGGQVYTSVDPSGKYVLAASYDNGYASVFPIQSDGTLKAATDTQQFAPPTPNTANQNASSAQTHSVRFNPGNGIHWAYVQNKGRNEIVQFSFDASSGKLLNPNPIPCTGGPRMIAFDSTGTFAYVITELSTELVVYTLDDTGSLTQKQRVSALPSNLKGSAGAHVLLHPNDKFVYTSNRTDNSIVVFARAADGKVSFLQAIKTMGTIPRNFDIDSEGKYLIAANQGDSGQANGSLIVFSIGDDGQLTQVGALVTGLESPEAVSIVTDVAP